MYSQKENIKMDFKFGITWLVDKLCYMPKINVQEWPFPAVQKDYVAPEEEKPKKTAKKTVKIHKATTRKPKIK